MNPPGYWMHETSGTLRPAGEAYLRGEEMTAEEIAAMRAYLRQWIMHPSWLGPRIATLRTMIDSLTTREAIATWLAIAEEEGVDPL